MELHPQDKVLAGRQYIRFVETTDSLIDEEIIKDREKQIYEIKKDMSTVRDLFIQIAGIIDHQEPDIISQNIKETEVEINIGVEELEKVYNKSWRCNVL